MKPTDVERLEALIISLRDQVDALADRMENQLADQARSLSRLEAELVELHLAVRPDLIERDLELGELAEPRS